MQSSPSMPASKRKAIGYAMSQSSASPVSVNGDMEPSEVQKFCQLGKEGLAMIRMAVERMGLSARAEHRILKLSRTIADLAGCDDVLREHVAEALQYRPRSLL
jgi:magnesium chelatase family protein